MPFDPKDLKTVTTTNKYDYVAKKVPEAIRYHAWSDKKPTPEKNINRKENICKEIHSLYPWRSYEDKAKFDLFFTPKDIVRTDPRTKFDPNLRALDDIKDEAIATRPRLTICPAVSVDDIPDPEQRKKLVNYMYMTVWQRACLEVPHTYTVRPIPNTTLEKKADPMQECFHYHIPLSPELRIKGKSMEPAQLTKLVHPTEAFFTKYEHKYKQRVGEDPFKNTITPEIKKEIRDLIEEEQLRVPFDKNIAHYSGYLPRLVLGTMKKQS